MEISKSKPKKCGIYYYEAISGSKIGWRYIGLTRNEFKIRDATHSRQLLNNKHHSHKLQNYYNKYGKDSLRFSILLECEEKDLCFYEKFFIKCFDSKKNGFNETLGGHCPSDATKKKCSFQNIITKEIYLSNSIREFAERFDLEYNGVSALVRGKFKYLYDWICLENKWRPEYYKVISPDGKEYEVVQGKTREFARKHNLSLNGFFLVLRIDGYSHKGWIKSGCKSRNLQKYFKFINIDGDIVEGKNLSAFSKKYGIDYDGVLKMSQGRLSQHRGWRIYKENIESLKIYKFISPDGIIYETDNQRQFARENNLTYGIIWKINSDENYNYRGWRKYIPGMEIKPFKEINYKLIFNKKLFIVNNLVEFAKEHNLYNCYLSKVANGEKESYKGWTLYKENEDI